MSGMKLGSTWHVVCLDKHGHVKWEDESHNLVVDVGLDDVLNKYFKGDSYTATHYIGLKGSGTITAADTMAAHGGWVEIVPYSGSRKTYSPASAVSRHVTNALSQASFTITVSASVAGGFVTNDSSAGGTSGILYGAADFTNVRTVVPSDTINITVVVSNGAA